MVNQGSCYDDGIRSLTGMQNVSNIMLSGEKSRIYNYICSNCNYIKMHMSGRKMESVPTR